MAYGTTASETVTLTGIDDQYDGLGGADLIDGGPDNDRQAASTQGGNVTVCVQVGGFFAAYPQNG